MEDKTPFVPRDVVQYLRATYSTDNLLTDCGKCRSAEQALGYMDGVTTVINHLAALAEAED